MSLSCELFGYLPSSNPEIVWTIDNQMLPDNSIYNITTMDGNRFVQNGGPFPIPSIISQLSFVANSSFTGRVFTCTFMNKLQVLIITSGTSLPASGEFIVKCILINNVRYVE